MNEVYEFLKSCETYYLATVEGDQPRVCPFGTVDIFEGKLYIQTGKSKNVSKQIAQNPNVELCAFKDGKWLRVAGKLIRDDRVEAKAYMLDQYPHLKNMYSAEDDNTEVLYFEDATATFASYNATIERCGDYSVWTINLNFAKVAEGLTYDFYSRTAKTSFVKSDVTAVVDVLH